MCCTAEEIEKKRQIALEKLALKNKSPNKNVDNSIKKYPFKFKHSPLKPYEKTTQILPSFNNAKDKTITGTCVLISKDRFSVEINGFNSQIIEIFKSLPTKNYNPVTKFWHFHLKDYNNLINKLQYLQPNVVIEKLPIFIYNYFSQLPIYNVNIDFDKIESELYNTLMPFQLDGIKFCIERDGRCLIADDMGLGKTLQALAVAHYYYDDWPLLIVTTASMKNIWENTIYKYLPNIQTYHIKYMVTSRDFIGDCKILIISHDLMYRCCDKLKEKHFGVFILDESHIVKNYKAKCTNSAIILSKMSKRVILLSGTPALSRPSELYSQLSLIDDKFFINFLNYSKRYCNGKQTNFGWDSTGKSNLQELELILNNKFMIRRTKEDVLKTLPSLKQEIIKLDVNLQQFNEEDRLYLNSLLIKYNNEKSSTKKHQLLLNYFQETAKIKIPSVCSYILQTIKYREKFLVFGHHQKMLDAISQILKKKNIKFIRIDGNTTSEQRNYFVDTFQNDDNCLVAVLSITAANAGLTLTSAKLVIFAELHWNPSILSQAESRAHRIGQQYPVNVKYLIAPNTSDDTMWKLLNDKQQILMEVGLSKDSFNNVETIPQDINKTEKLTNDLNFTQTKNLKITSYFTTSKNNDDKTCDIFDDGLDDVLGSIDI